MAGRHLIDFGVVVEAVVDQIERRVAHAVGQRLAPAFDAGGAAAFFGFHEILDPLALDRLLVDVEHAVYHLDAVAGQPDHAFDVIGRIILGQPKHHDVAALGRARPDSAGENRGRERKRIMAVTVRVFRHEQVVAHQQRRLHRAGGDIEGLKQEGANDERNEERVKDHASGLGNAAFFSFCAGGHTHLPLIHG